ncbi:MAG: Glycine betaine/carnitine transport ATP-binding protein GbuA [Alphaproteobacteria bacterium MarineAlpha5_Bin12]|nr:glycine/betaine ABC transporter [Pelagibacteraceae bacterium]PPR41948.1 MAG: Glycine betaine/carnitine transport ATP-binding protein GbuA [Alphaproteobacteria bacterium MarineAlpha5_Bin12]|tara:strand:+ start:372 stop:1403 length:1032 start_codon:yes stop_codon:yes gene_type:complete
MPKIEINNIYKIFGNDPSSVLPMVQNGATKEEILEETGHTVGLDDVSIKIEEGETFVCMGLSGSGKSTLIRHINRLIDPTHGKVFVDGINVMDLKEQELIDFRKSKMSMVFQRFGLFPHKTVIQNVAYGLEIQGKELNERNEIAQSQIQAVGLQGFEHQYPSQLSGGMQQRVGLARALAPNPGILLMDEAFSALDPLIRSDMQKQLLELQSELKKTIVFITHDLDESLKIGDHIGILNAGKLVQVGRPEEIILNPADDYVKAFVKDVNRSKVLRAKTVMISSEKFNGKDKTLSNTFKVHEDIYIEEFLPEVLENRSTIVVVDKQGNTKGYITEKELAFSLTKT